MCETLFADTLEGARLIDNRSTWRRFPNLRNERWSAGNAVLVGDALHTAHFSIGSGTRLALEDVIALVRALAASDWRVAPALAAYEAARRPLLERLLRAADASGAWYERFDQHMALEPWAFARSYIQRTGRVDADRLAAIAPRFAQALERRGLH